MKTNLIKISAAILLLMLLSACVVAPRPVGYRVSSTTVMPTYVDGQYVGMQASAEEAVESANGMSTSQTNVVTYAPPATSMIVQTQIYQPYYQPYYPPYSPPVYVNPGYGVGVGIGTGLGIGIGINYARGWRGGWHRGGHRGWHRR